MAVTKWWAIWDIQNGGSGYEGIGEKTFKKGNTVPSQILSPAGLGTGTEVGGLHGTVFNCKMAVIAAESGEEACLIAEEAYGKKSGSAAWPLAEKELEFKKT